MEDHSRVPAAPCRVDQERDDRPGDATTSRRGHRVDLQEVRERSVGKAGTGVTGLEPREPARERTAGLGLRENAPESARTEFRSIPAREPGAVPIERRGRVAAHLFEQRPSETEDGRSVRGPQGTEAHPRTVLEPDVGTRRARCLVPGRTGVRAPRASGPAHRGRLDPASRPCLPTWRRGPPPLLEEPRNELKRSPDARGARSMGSDDLTPRVLGSGLGSSTDKTSTDGL